MILERRTGNYLPRFSVQNCLSKILKNCLNANNSCYTVCQGNHSITSHCFLYFQHDVSYFALTASGYMLVNNRWQVVYEELMKYGITVTMPLESERPS